MTRRTARRRRVEPQARRAKRSPSGLRARHERMPRDTVPLADLLERVGGDALAFITQEAARLLAVARLLEGIGPKRRRDAARLRRSVAVLGAVCSAARDETHKRMRKTPGGAPR